MDAGTRRHLPRLGQQFYQGAAYVHWTLNIERRVTGWLTPRFFEDWKLVLLHTCCRYRLIVPVFTLMPDHVHLLAIGRSDGGDQRRAIEFLQKNLRTSLGSANWQRQSFDHVLREHEREKGALSSLASYILQNPVRARLVAAPADYGYTGACIPGYPEIDVLHPDYWPVFWRIYNRDGETGHSLTLAATKSLGAATG
ncbi:MAG TPA: hypothetical protein VHE61_11085 [Opitutaceae bacterium]|nr:hypothetical protein [Opitutaceae bacterium]